MTADFSTYPMNFHKLAVFVKLNEDFVHDASFGVDDDPLRYFAKNFAKAADDAFLNGSGKTKSTGFRHAEKGTEVSTITNSLSYDVRHSPVSVRSLKEKFVLYNQISYLAIEYMDGKLIRREAIKALKITE